MITLDEFHRFIEHNLAYEQKLISILDDLGRQIYLDNLGQLHSNYGKTIKVEGMEKYNLSIYRRSLELSEIFNHDGPVTCHAFRSFPNSKSFPRHSDPDDVYLQILFGEFTLNFDDVSIHLKQEDRHYIKANRPHWATHNDSCLFLSFGIEKFLVDKL
jgi:mannose-6-phosphate isomerase-like protein (cupin superfamily)